MTPLLITVNRDPEAVAGKGLPVLLALLVLLSGLEAYAIWGIPLQWLSQCFVLVVAGYCAATFQKRAFPGWKIHAVYWLYAGLVTLTSALINDYESKLPVGSTTQYEVFVTLRLFSIAAFSAATFVGYVSMLRIPKQALRIIYVVGCIIAVFAVYIYFAQVHGVWEPPRSRLGTNGGDQVTRFTYAFHRAMGTFREPSHLAQWLVLPVFAAFSFGASTMVKFLLLSVLLLTGSLTGIIPTISMLALAAVILLVRARRVNKLFVLVTTLLVCLLAYGAFGTMAVSQVSSEISLAGTIMKRVTPILDEGGMLNTNRGYVYRYWRSRDFSAFGVGLGHSNLLLSEYLGHYLVTSFLNLYMATYVALGAPGAILLALGLLSPFYRVARAARSGGWRVTPGLLFLAAGHGAWLMVYAVHAEELNLGSGLILGLLLGLLARHRDGRRGATVFASGAMTGPIQAQDPVRVQ